GRHHRAERRHRMGLQTGLAEQPVGDKASDRPESAPAHHRAAATNSPTVSPTRPQAPSTSPVKPPTRRQANSTTPPAAKVAAAREAAPATGCQTRSMALEAASPTAATSTGCPGPSRKAEASPPSDRA